MLTDAHTKTRTRLTGVLFTGNAIVSTAYIAVVTVSTLVSEQITGSTSLSGIPGTLGTAGVAAGAAGLSALSLRVGRRPSFTLGFAIAALGSVSVGFAIMLSSFSLLLLGFGVSRHVGLRNGGVLRVPAAAQGGVERDDGAIALLQRA